MSQLSPPLQIVDYVCGAVKTQAVHACADLGIADLLRTGPQSAAQLAQVTGTDPTNLYRLLRLLVAMEVLNERAPRACLEPHPSRATCNGRSRSITWR